MQRYSLRLIYSVRWWLALTCLAGCSTASRAVAPEASPSPSIAQLAEHIDPGPQPPLTRDLPAWVFDMLDLSSTATNSASVLRASSASEQQIYEWTLKESMTDTADIVTAIRSLARAAVLAEQADKKEPNNPETLAQLAAVYARLDVPELVHEQGLFVQWVQIFVASNPAEGARLEDLVGIVRTLVEGAGPLHRHTVAKLSRLFPEHPALPDALLAIAQARRGDDDPVTVEMSRAALSRLGADANAQQQLSLARTCFAALDVACGEAALQTARSVSGEADAEELQSAEEDAVIAHRIIKLKEAPSFEQRLQRARAHFELRRHAAAKSEFEALRRAAPEDARPVAGLAQHAIETRLDFLGAHRLIDEAGPLRNGDQLYYEIAIGTRAMVALSTIAPRFKSSSREESVAMLRPLLARMRTDVDGYMSLGHADARFLGLVLEVAEEMLGQFSTAKLAARPAFLNSLTERALKLQREIPTNEHAYRLLMSASLFEANKDVARVAVGTIAPVSDDQALATRRVRAICDLAALWNDPDLAQQAVAAAKELAGSSDEIKLARADAVFVEAALGVPDRWQAVAEAYEVVLNGTIEGADPRVLNNIGVAMWHLGNAELATQLWSVSGASDGDYTDVAKLNTLVAQPDTKAASFEGLAEKDREIQLAAKAWLLARAKTGKDRRRAALALKTAVEKQAKDSSRPVPPDPYSRIALEGSFEAGLGYGIEDGLEIALDSGASLWGILAPPRSK